MPVEVVPYNPEWRQWFIELREPIWKQIGDLVVDIVHVGSTSVDEMSAKPVIDMDIVVDSWTNFPEIIEGLLELGYIHIGDLGIKEREAFKLEKPSLHRHNLYVCHIDSTAYKNHVLLKKHLNENSADFQRYTELKFSLADSAFDTNDYCRSKTELILEFLKAEGVSEKELEEIRSENLS